MGGCRILKQPRSSFEVFPSIFEVENLEISTGYILATKFCDTTDFPHKIRFQSHQKYRKPPFYTGYFLSQVREGGRTVGSGRVATIIE